jgi:hypothetical protein
MRLSLKLLVLLSALLIVNLFANAFLIYAESKSPVEANSSIKDIAADRAILSLPTSNEQVTAQEVPRGMVNGGAPPRQSAEDVKMTGASGSGWTPDMQIAGTAVDETNPSIADYINPITGAVTMYIAIQKWDTAGNRWYMGIYRSNNGGSSWYYWFYGQVRRIEA